MFLVYDHASNCVDETSALAASTTYSLSDAYLIASWTPGETFVCCSTLY